MTGSTLGGFVVALALVAFVVFAGVAIHEFSYASDHPFNYGPAKVIAWGGLGGCALALAVGLLAVAWIRTNSGSD